MAVAEVTFEDEFDDGAVLVIEKKFRGGSTLYSYAAIKAGGFWYVTGQGTVPIRGMSSSSFLDFLIQGWDHNDPPKIYWAPYVVELEPSRPWPKNRPARVLRRQARISVFDEER